MHSSLGRNCISCFECIKLFCWCICIMSTLDHAIKINVYMWLFDCWEGILSFFWCYTRCNVIGWFGLDLLPLHVISTKAIQGTSWVLPFFFIFSCIAIFYFPMDAVGPYWLWDCLALIPYEQSSCGHTGFEFLTCLVECWFCCFRIFLWSQLNREKKVVKNDYSWYSLETI